MSEQAPVPATASRWGTRLDTYERRTRFWMVGLSLLFLAVFAIPILVDDVPRAVTSALIVVGNTIWFIFIADLIVRAALANHSWTYLLYHPFDVIVCVLPMFGPLRVLRVFAAGQSLITRGAQFAVGQIAVAIVVFATLIGFIGALTVYSVERRAPDGTIKTFGDAAWWAIETMSTVGYGDMVPVTTAGRFAAAALMVLGVSVLGLTTATLATWFVRKVGQETEETETLESAILSELQALRAEVAQLRESRQMPDSAEPTP